MLASCVAKAANCTMPEVPAPAPGRLFFVAGALFGLVGVAAGAFGAHALKATLAPDLLTVFETAVRYQLVHALALLVCGVAFSGGAPRVLRAAGWLFVAGITLFSGSLYGLTLTGMRWLGAITPVGGVLLLTGWLCLALAARHLDFRGGHS